MAARIYRPAPNAMQSGQGKSKRWLLEYEPERPRMIEPLMGYTSSADMRQQVKLWFDSKEEAVDYCTREGIAYRLEEPKEKAPKRISYSDNFKFNRSESWTH